MLRFAWMTLAIAALLAAPVHAQTYDPAHPVCIQTYGIGGNGIDCSYASMPGLGIGPRRAMHRQSVLCGGACAAERPRLLTRLA
jgi:hypothetical protein